eukprot:gene8923-9875_t
MWTKLNACRRILSSTRSFPSKAVQQQRKMAFSSAAKEEVIEEAPALMRWGILKISIISIPFMYFGAMLSKRGAEFLEEWNIFVPEDDED